MKGKIMEAKKKYKVQVYAGNDSCLFIGTLEYLPRIHEELALFIRNDWHHYTVSRIVHFIGDSARFVNVYVR